MAVKKMGSYPTIRQTVIPESPFPLFSRGKVGMGVFCQRAPHPDPPPEKRGGRGFYEVHPPRKAYKGLQATTEHMGIRKIGRYHA